MGVVKRRSAFEIGGTLSTQCGEGERRKEAGGGGSGVAVLCCAPTLVVVVGAVGVVASS